MKIVVIGGHLSPALAVLSELKDKEILYLGRKYTFEGDKTLSLEYQVVNSLGVNFKNITTGRLQRNFSIHSILSLLKFPIGFVQSIFILRNFKPNVILGFGGYIQIPVVIAAVMLRIPIVIHEQSLGSGLANRVSSIFASKILISWASSLNFFPRAKTVLTGLPLRKEILQSSRPEKSEDKLQIDRSQALLIYVTGGTSGSHSINVLVEKNLRELLRIAKVFHQTGGALEFGDFERLSQTREKLPENLKKRYMIMKFVDSKDAAKILLSSNLVITRAGMNTISEIIFFNKSSLLIPLRMGGEQKDNASFLKNLGLAEILYEENLSPFQFINSVEGMLRNLGNYKLKVDVGNLIKEDAAKKIAQETLNATKEI